MTVAVLVVEDGLEYTETLTRFLPEGFALSRAGTGPEALAALARGGVDVVFLDMRFDRAPEGALLGDPEAAADRFNGDPIQGRRFLEDHQGNFILAAIREAGHTLPVLLSYDFGAEPGRWERLRSRYGPVAYLDDMAGPREVATVLGRLAAGAG